MTLDLFEGVQSTRETEGPGVCVPASESPKVANAPPDEEAAPLRCVMSASADHLSDRTWRLLETGMTPAKAYPKDGTGFMIHLPAGELRKEDFPQDLWGVIEVARRRNADWIDIDTLADEVPGLALCCREHYSDGEQVDDAFAHALHLATQKWVAEHGSEDLQIQMRKAQPFCRRVIGPYDGASWAEDLDYSSLVSIQAGARGRAIDAVIHWWEEFNPGMGVAPSKSSRFVNARYRSDAESAAYLAKNRAMLPSQVIKALNDAFGESVTLDIRRHHAAVALFSAFGLEEEKFEASNGKVSLTTSIYSAKKDHGRDAGKRFIAEGNCERIRNVFSHLRKFAWYLDDGAMTQAIVQAERDYSAYEVELISRAKIVLGPGLTVTTFTDRFQWTFTEAMAGRLREFIAEYKGYEPPTMVDAIESARIQSAAA